MPSLLNLKFKGNKSFVPFSNLSDADSLTKTWKVCTKVAGFLEQGQRLENLSWRLWHLQNLIVDSDNAKSKREFRKLSKCMGDKLDKEKGRQVPSAYPPSSHVHTALFRSIEELRAPGFKRNHSTAMIQQRAAEKEREREAHQNGTIHRMQFTFSVDQPAPPTASSVHPRKPDLKPSSEFRDTVVKRGRPTTRSTAVEPSVAQTADRDAPLTQRGRKSTTTSTSTIASNTSPSTSPDLTSSASLRFPTLFSNDFGPSALLYPTPTVTNPMTYGEGVGLNTGAVSDGFSIVRPTIELPLDELLNADSPGGWSSSGVSNGDARNSQTLNIQEDIDMKTALPDGSFSGLNQPMLSPTTLRNLVSPTQPAEDVVPRTITPSRLNPEPAPNLPVTGKRPSLSLRTQSVSTRSSGPSATPVNTLSSGQTNTTSNSAPGGVKAECSNCGATHTPLWRRGLNDELNCNACGLYCKLHKRPRPKSMRNNHGEGRSQAAPRQESQEVVAQCYNCHTTATPLWRKDDEGKTVCNACGLYYKLHGSARPISMKSDVIRKRARHDARRASGGAVSETPSASPGASRRPSPTAEATPTLAPDSTTQISYHEEASYVASQHSELMSALGATHTQNGHLTSEGIYQSQLSYQSFPGPYHPDYLTHQNGGPADSLSFASGDNSDFDGSETRSIKRRRMSNDSISEPPSSAVSYSSFSDFSSTSSIASQRNSMDFPFSSYAPSFSLMRGNSNALWHPPMAAPDGSPHFPHPPMLPQANEDSPMDFLHAPMHQDDTDALFATFLHPPMVHPDDSPKVSMGSLQPHPPMLPQDWAPPHDFYDSSMHTY